MAGVVERQWTPASPGRLGSLLLLCAVGLASVGSLVQIAREHDDAPRPADVADAAGYLRSQGLSDDDVVLVAPPWSLWALQQLGDDPQRGGRLVPADGPWDRLHHRRHRRVWLWREPDAEPWLLGRSVGLFDLGAAPAHVAGSIDLFVVVDAVARFDLRRRFADVNVAVEGGAVCVERSGGPSPTVRCPARGAKVSLEWAQVTENGQPVVVIAVPPGPGLRIEVDAVDVGDELIVAVGHTRPSLGRLLDKRLAGGVVTTRVLLDDVEVGRVVSEPSFVVEPQRRALVKRFVGERPKDAGFFPHVLDTRGQRGQARRLAFVVSSDLGDDGVMLSVGLDAFVPGG
jgi:hypothetical protein